MSDVEPRRSIIERWVGRAWVSEHPSPVRVALATLLPPSAALLLEFYAWSAHGRWSLFYVAVFVSAWLGGFTAGVGAAVLSATIMWWFFVPPVHVAAKPFGPDYAFALLFVVMGVVVSDVLRRRHQAVIALASALRDAGETAERLHRALDERMLFASVIENSSDFIGITTEDDRPFYVNPAGRRLVGLPLDYPLTRTRRTDFFPPELLDMPATIDAEVKANGRWSGETLFRHWATGERIAVSDSHFLVREPGTGRVLGRATITRDIRAEVRQRDELTAVNQRLVETMQELSRNQRYLQAILDYSPEGIVIKDLESRYVIANQAFEAQTGVRVVAAVGHSDFDIFPREAAERFRENDRRVRETKTALVSEQRIRADDDRVFRVSKFPLFDDADAVFAIGVIWSEITQQKRDEEVLRRAMQDLRTAQHVAHVGSWHWDFATDQVTWSDELYRIFGREPGSPPPRIMSTDAHVLTPESAARLRAAVEQLRADGEPYEVELEIVRPDGSRGWCAARGEAWCAPDGTVVGTNGTAADVTQIKELQRLREEWTSVIAHDLRQPIGVVIMASELLLELRPDGVSADERSTLARIESAGKTLKRMVDDLLDLSLLDANRLTLDREWIDPQVMIREIVERLAPVTGGDRVKCHGQATSARVCVDPMRIGQVVGNLLSNAVKYGDPDAEIGVWTECVGSEIRISVSNRGRGIAPDELSRLFARFARSPSTRGAGVPGLGLGLYISKGIVEAHGGRMWAESVPGESTTFRFALPSTAVRREAA